LQYRTKADNPVSYVNDHEKIVEHLKVLDTWWSEIDVEGYKYIKLDEFKKLIK